MSVRFAIASGLLAVLAAATAGCAPMKGSADRTAAATPRQCVFQTDIRSFRVSQDARNVYVRGLNSTVYRLETMGACPDLENALSIGFQPAGGLSSLCVGDWTRIVPVAGSHDRMPCSVRMTGALTEAEVAALPARDRP